MWSTFQGRETKGITTTSLRYLSILETTLLQMIHCRLALLTGSISHIIFFIFIGLVVSRINIIEISKVINVSSELKNIILFISRKTIQVVLTNLNHYYNWKVLIGHYMTLVCFLDILIVVNIHIMDLPFKKWWR